jgi:amino acid permease
MISSRKKSGNQLTGIIIIDTNKKKSSKNGRKQDLKKRHISHVAMSGIISSSV